MIDVIVIIVCMWYEQHIIWFGDWEFGIGMWIGQFVAQMHEPQ